MSFFDPLIELIGKKGLIAVGIFMSGIYLMLALLSDPWWAAPAGCTIGCFPGYALIFYVLISEHIAKRNYNRKDSA